VIPLRRLVTLAIVAVLLTAACSSGSNREVAKVGETSITEQDLAALFNSNTLPVDEELRSTIFALTARVVLIDAMQTDLGLSLDQTAVQDLYDQLVAEMEAQNSDPAQYLNLPNAGLGMLRFNAEIAVVRRAVVGALVTQPGYLDGLFADPTAISTVCAKHILVATEEEALAVKDRLQAGEDFAAVAGEVSLDTGTPDGDLGCQAANAYVEPFATAAATANIGEITGPIETEYGWHVLVVSDRTTLNRDDVVADPLGTLPSTELSYLWQDWFNHQLQNATVELDPKYGTWTPTGITPPES
jgi:hypothetical protein